MERREDRNPLTYKGREHGFLGHSDDASQQRGGVHEQRDTHAAIAVSNDDAGGARSEAIVLELSRVSGRETDSPLPV